MKFTIEKNKHSCSPAKIKLWSGEMRGTFVLHSNMWYDTAIYGTHLNKLVGFSTDWLNENSVRLAWRPSLEKGKFEIYAYIHLNGTWVRSSKLKHDLILTVHEEVMYSWSLLPVNPSPEGNNARLVVGGSAVERAYDVIMGSGWFRQFYYGGVPLSPWKMSCDITVEGYLSQTATLNNILSRFKR